MPPSTLYPSLFGLACTVFLVLASASSAAAAPGAAHRRPLARRGPDTALVNGPALTAAPPANETALPGAACATVYVGDDLWDPVREQVRRWNVPEDPNGCKLLFSRLNTCGRLLSFECVQKPHGSLLNETATFYGDGLSRACIRSVVRNITAAPLGREVCASWARGYVAPRPRISP
ncbi:MAG: hypothetical protein M1832_002870 [Thelocarpon impressellum]|nr:MAG: hypothetical protein M1832_002870 [Thelocarpon impressellum]